MSKLEKETPLMKQFNRIKSKYPDALLLFRVGDFYETFGKDAIKSSRILDIVLTNRANGSSKIELAGFPYHALDTYLPKLVQAGERVAICDQLEDPKTTKKIVKRGVTELVTPGVSYRDTNKNQKSNNFLASIYFGQKNIGISLLDNSTGEFLAAEGNSSNINKLLQSFNPSEVIYQHNEKSKFISNFGSSFFSYPLDEWVYTDDYTNELLINQFNTKSLKGFGIEKLKSGSIAAGSILHYLKITKHNLTSHISTISRIDQERYVWMDKFTMRNLELFVSNNQDSNTLINIIDSTLSPMGSRMMRKWLALPLKEISDINQRLDIVKAILNDEKTQEICSYNIEKIGDLERLISKVSTKRLSPRDSTFPFSTKKYTRSPTLFGLCRVDSIM